MVRTRVGYAGGKKVDPTYRDMGDHTETMQVDFDSKVISYEKLIRLFFKEHNPCATPWGRQYMSILLTHSDEQAKTAKKLVAEIEETTGKDVTTEIAPLVRFYRAEDYHQKYSLRRSPRLLAELAEMYPSAKDLTDSTAAARLNAYLGGHRSKAKLEEEIDSLGLSEEGRTLLRGMVRR